MKKWMANAVFSILLVVAAWAIGYGALYLLAGPVTDADRDLYRDHAFTSPNN